ncbi:hypothetical protein OF83DRAFT_1172117 [Amylostereum chailletii]|nr:hypothetical protein OF83DRAFT_1172117 [Amylostereum chailletii]
MLGSSRSPRQPPGGIRRRKPLGRRQPSVFNTIKTIVSAPLAWLSQPSETEDTPGKRRRLPQAPSDDPDDTGPLFNAKRIRLDSPERDGHNHSGYLDPPLALIESRPPPPPQRHTNPPPIRQTTLPTIQQRTMSMDPPARHTAPLRHEPTLVHHPLGRDASMDSSPRPLRIRSTLTPSRSGLDFGPAPKRTDRNPSEPPPLAALMSNPIFVKPPQNDIRRVSDPSAPITLGALAQQRSSSIPRMHSTLILPSSSDGIPLRPINAAERALHELEVYRTPLLPTRLRSSLSDVSPALSDPLFQSREKTRSIVLMKRDKREAKPRLGMAHRHPALSDSPKSKEVKEKGAKPYAGAGGLKKLLAKRKQEEREAEKEKDRIRQQEDDDAQAMADDNGPVKYASKITAPPRVQADYSRKVSAPLGPSLSMAHRGAASSKQMGSLRTGKNGTTTARTVGPTRRPRGRFSAVEDDEDVVDSGGFDAREESDGQVEAPALPKYEAPTGFTFAKPTSSLPVTAPVPPAEVASSAKTLDEPPITTLPFSFGTSSVIAPSPATAPVIVSSPSTPLQPTIALIPPTPAVEQSKTAPAQPVPNFFTNSDIFAKTNIAPPEPAKRDEGKEVPTFSYSAPPAPTPVPVSVSEPGVGTEPTPSVKLETAPTPSPVPFAWGGQITSLPPSSVPSQPTAPSTSTSVEEKKHNPPTPAPTVSGQPKPLFGSGFAGFGTTTSSTTTGSAPEVSKPIFSFGPPASTSGTTTPASSAPSAEAPQPLLGVSKGFSFGHSQPETGKTKEPEKTQTTSAFSFGATPATPPPASGKPTGLAFGGSSGATTVTNDVLPKSTSFSFASPATSTGFSFGATTSSTPVRPVTPPNNDKDNEMRMEESPTRDLNAQAKPPLLQLQVPGPGTGFNTGTSPFGQASGGGFGFNTKPDTNNVPTTSSFSFSKTTETQSSGGFTFGVTKPAENASGFSFGSSNPANSGGFGFGASKPPEASNPFNFGPPQTTEKAATSTFSFGPPKQEAFNGFTFAQPSKGTESRPSSSGFAFGGTQQHQPSQSSITPGSSPFSFGQPLPSANAPTFGASAPVSPAFGNNNGSGSFSFGGPASAPVPPTNAPPFGFGTGSQPASPAVAPGSAGGFSFAGAPSTPSSPFTSTGGNVGGSMFTMGAPPSSTPGGGRQIKKLPARRGGGAKR